MMKGTIVKHKTSLAVLLISAVIYIAAVNPAQAVPVTFSFTGVGSGNLDATVFTDAAFEVLISADTDDVSYVPGADTPGIRGLNGTIDIAGIGVGAFIKPLYVFDCHPCVAVGFGNDAQHDLIDLFLEGVGLDTYNLDTSFGPITDTTPLFYQFEGVELTIGELTFTGMSYATFTANVVPEPTTVLLLSLGALILRRKR